MYVYIYSQVVDLTGAVGIVRVQKQTAVVVRRMMSVSEREWTSTSGAEA